MCKYIIHALKVKITGSFQLYKSPNVIKNVDKLGAGGLSPVILATQEAEIRRIMVQSKS
jgi:hypothetical protein